MSQTLILNLSEDVYTALRQHAEAAGTSPTRLAEAALEQQFRQTATAPSQAADQQAARSQFERHFGAVNLGRATGIDNESIDADLAREYSEMHEESGCSSIWPITISSRKDSVPC